MGRKYQILIYIYVYSWIAWCHGGAERQLERILESQDDSFSPTRVIRVLLEAAHRRRNASSNGLNYHHVQIISTQITQQVFKAEPLPCHMYASQRSAHVTIKQRLAPQRQLTPRRKTACRYLNGVDSGSYFKYTRQRGTPLLFSTSMSESLV